MKNYLKETNHFLTNPKASLKALGVAGVLVFSSFSVEAQKKPLDHSVYDSWESIGARALSNDGQWIMYQINQQEGDKKVVLRNTNSTVELTVERGEKPTFVGGSNFAVFSIRPTFDDLKAVKNKKKKEDEIAKDSLGIYNLKTNALAKIANVKSFKTPEKKGDYLAYLLEPAKDTVKGKKPAKKGGKDAPLDLVLKNLLSNKETVFNNVSDYYFDANGQYLVFVTKDPNAKKKEDKKGEENKEEEQETKVATAEVAEKEVKKEEAKGPFGVFVVNLKTNAVTTLLEGKGKYTQFSFDDAGKQLAFIGNEDEDKTLVKTYTVYYADFKGGASTLATDSIKGMPTGWVISENYKPNFSKSGKRMFLGVAPKPVAKDTTLIADDHAVLDIWHFSEDILKTQQLANLDRELKKSYLATIDLISKSQLVALGDETLNGVQPINEGNSEYAFASSNYGRTVERQWDISGVNSYYIIDVKTGKRVEVVSDLRGFASVSPGGTKVVYFNSDEKNWYVYDIASKTTRLLNKGIDVSFADELADMPDLPSAYGIKGWTEKDESVLIRDRYDIWEFFLSNNKAPRNVTNSYGRKHKIVFDILRLDPEQRFVSRTEKLILSAFNDVSKYSGLYSADIKSGKNPVAYFMEPFSGFNNLIKAKDANVYSYLKGSFEQPYNLYVTTNFSEAKQLTDINKQQENYNWGTAELVNWITPKGNEANGVLFKPENFDPNKKYPMIVYFYERLSDNLYRYEAPAPTPSRLNIPFYVSNEYLVFTPDIHYEDGYPGKAAEEYINSGVEYLKQNAWVNGDKIGIQGQSWGGYQVAHLITVTDMYAAAWSGAPVVNMTSAYGGIRWTTGMSRQFQYEKTQSRLGKDLWEGYDLYIENSPLFNMPKVTTPVAIMHNDQDGAVPWYQGIEMFMALRRLGKPAWLLNYNGDDHNLIKRQNRKDIQIRQQQFFDHYLKDAKAPVWMVKGIPATMKGKDWGFELTDEKVK